MKQIIFISSDRPALCREIKNFLQGESLKKRGAENYPISVAADANVYTHLVLPYLATNERNERANSKDNRYFIVRIEEDGASSIEEKNYTGPVL